MSDNIKQDNNNEEDSELLTEDRVKLKKPDMYAVILLNDDYTPQEFVVWVLSRIFFKNQEQSKQIMLEAHQKGRSVVGVYTHDVAQTKIKQTVDLAEEHEHPLQCIMEVVGESE